MRPSAESPHILRAHGGPGEASVERARPVRGEAGGLPPPRPEARKAVPREEAGG